MLDAEMAAMAGSGQRVTAIRARFADPPWILYFSLIVLNVLDVITTAKVIDRGGAERNPFVQPFVHDMVQVAGLKAVVLVLVAVLLTRCPGSRIAELALTATAGWYLAVVMWNTSVLTIH